MKIILGLVVALVGYGVFWEARRRWKRRARFAGRAVLSDAEIFAQFYAQSDLRPEAVAKYWNEVGRLMRVPAGRLRPSDRFDVELAPVAGAEMADEIEELGEFFDDERQRLGLSVNLKQMKTLDELIRAFAAPLGR